MLVAERTDESARPQPTLLVCPMSVVGNWQREAERFAPGLAVHVRHGADRASSEHADAIAGTDLVITTYALALRDADVLGSIEWGRVVLDAAQNVKNGATKQAKAIRRLPAAHRIALTDTPVENRLSELWSIMDFANPGILGPIGGFKSVSPRLSRSSVTRRPPRNSSGS
jgi:SNF2 family DNA or RNA helicase